MSTIHAESNALELTAAGVKESSVLKTAPLVLSHLSFPNHPAPASKRRPLSSVESWQRYETMGTIISGEREASISGGMTVAVTAIRSVSAIRRSVTIVLTLGSGNGGDGVGVDVVLGTLTSERLAERDEGELGSTVVGLSEVSVDTGSGGSLYVQRRQIRRGEEARMELTLMMRPYFCFLMMGHAALVQA